MSVNGIEIKVGHKWRRRDKTEVTIETAGVQIVGLNACFTVQDETGETYQADGTYCVDGAMHPYDLVELIVIEDAPATVNAAIDLLVAIRKGRVAAPDLLEAAAGHMRDRAATYDKPEGERSMTQTVSVFNQFHGTSLTEAQGWHFMQILKDVRLFANPTNPHRDSVEDGVAYSALKGEAILKGGV